MEQFWSFKSLLAEHRDVTLKDYPFGALGALTFAYRYHSFLVVGKSKKHKGSFSALSLDSTARIRQDLEWANWEFSRNSEGNGTAQASYTPSNALKFKGKLDLEYPNEAKVQKYHVTANYRGNGANYKVTLTRHPWCVVMSALQGSRSLGAGCRLVADLDARKISEFRLLGWWVQRNAKLVAALETEFGGGAQSTVKLHYLYQLTSATKVATTVLCHLDRRDSFVRIAGKHQYDGNTVFRCKLDSEGGVGVSVVRTVNEYIKLTSATEIDSRKSNWNTLNNIKIGFKLNLNYQEYSDC